MRSLIRELWGPGAGNVKDGIRRLKPSKEEDAQARAAARLRVGGLAGPVGTVAKENGLGWGIEPAHHPSSSQHGGATPPGALVLPCPTPPAPPI